MAKETMGQHKVKGYRELSEAEVQLMNEAKALGEQFGTFIEKLRATQSPVLDQRWIAIGATQMQQGLMAVVRGIAQPTTF